MKPSELHPGARVMIDEGRGPLSMAILIGKDVDNKVQIELLCKREAFRAGFRFNQRSFDQLRVWLAAVQAPGGDQWYPRFLSPQLCIRTWAEHERLCGIQQEIDRLRARDAATQLRIALKRADIEGAVHVVHRAINTVIDIRLDEPAALQLAAVLNGDLTP